MLTILHGAGQKVFFNGNDDNAIYLCEDGQVLMSGENNTGQLGRGSVTPSNIPVPLSGIDGLGTAPRCKQVQIEGVSTFLALTVSGDTVLSWGINDYGQAGDGTIGMKTSPVLVKGVNGAGILGNIKQIATGNNTAYALTEEGKVVCWGANSFGQAGIGNFNTPILYPSYVLKAPGDTLKNVKSINAGGVSGYALLCDGTVWAWGRNNLGQLGQGTLINSEFAIPVKNKTGTGVLANIIQIEAGDNTAFALSSKDTLFCWGPNWDGRLGTGNFTEQLLPSYVTNAAGTGKLSGVIDVAAGQGHGMVLLADKSLYAWGINGFGQLGQNDTIPSNRPLRVKSPDGTGFLSGVNHIAVGDKFSMVRTDDHKLFVWGENTLGQLGVDDHVHRWLPVELSMPCTITSDELPGAATMAYPSTVCMGANSGEMYLTRFHSSILRWEQSINNFATVTSIGNKDFAQPFLNLTQNTSYRAVLRECSTTFYSSTATIVMDSVTQPGRVLASATVRISDNSDTLELINYKGVIKQWEISHDNFVSDVSVVGTGTSQLTYSNLAQTTFYRVLVQQGACPAKYSDTAVIRTVGKETVKVYNGFTPDGDNINDTWVIDFIGLFPENKVEIYNRWGQLVYSSTGYDNERNVWRGENNVSEKGEVADGTYFYVVSLGEGLPPSKGFVVINRGNVHE